MNLKSLVDNRMSWKTVESFFSDKSRNFENISLMENDRLLSGEFEIAKIFNKCFQNLVPNLDLKVPNTRKWCYSKYQIIQVSEPFSKNAILVFVSKQYLLLAQKRRQKV